MIVPCPTCGGIGRIAQPMPPGTVMMYCGPNGESWPMIGCRTCGGTGWIENGIYGVPAQPPCHPVQPCQPFGNWRWTATGQSTTCTVPRPPLITRYL